MKGTIILMAALVLLATIFNILTLKRYIQRKKKLLNIFQLFFLFLLLVVQIILQSWILDLDYIDMRGNGAIEQRIFYL